MMIVHSCVCSVSCNYKDIDDDDDVLGKLCKKKKMIKLNKLKQFVSGTKIK